MTDSGRAFDELLAAMERELGHDPRAVAAVRRAARQFRGVRLRVPLDMGETEEQVHAAHHMLASGYRRAAIRTALCARYDISEATAYRRITRAMERPR